jgi:hypothetical protein
LYSFIVVISAARIASRSRLIRLPQPALHRAEA